MANTIHNWPPTNFDIPCAGEQFKKWQRFVYKGESFVRFPLSCCDCDTVSYCLEAIFKAVDARTSILMGKKSEVKKDVT